MKISLDSHFEKFITDQLEAGRYKTANQIILAGLQLLEQHELRSEKLQAEIAKGYINDPVAFDSNEIKNSGKAHLLRQR